MHTTFLLARPVKAGQSPGSAGHDDVTADVTVADDGTLTHKGKPVRQVSRSHTDDTEVREIGPLLPRNTRGH
jgi:hypothetical protein